MARRNNLTISISRATALLFLPVSLISGAIPKDACYFWKPRVADAWLSGSAKLDSSCLLHNEPDLMWYPVTPAMDTPSFNGPDCIKEVRLKGEDTNSIKKFFLKKTVKDSSPAHSQSKASIIDFKEGELK